MKDLKRGAWKIKNEKLVEAPSKLVSAETAPFGTLNALILYMSIVNF